MVTKNLYITQHLGLGDMIICQAIVKIYTRQYQIVHIPVYNIYLNQAKRIYEDYPKVQFHIIQFYGNVDDPERYQFILQYLKLYEGDIIRIGGKFAENANNIIAATHCLNDLFYIPAKIQKAKQWQIQVVKRNLDKELKNFNSYKVNLNQYIIIIQDRRRKTIDNKLMIINRGLINNVYNYPIISIQKVSSIFDLCYLLENAYQIHTIDTSLTVLIDQCCNLDCNKVYIHKYVRSQQRITQTIYKGDFNLIWN